MSIARCGLRCLLLLAATTVAPDAFAEAIHVGGPLVPSGGAGLTPGLARPTLRFAAGTPAKPDTPAKADGTVDTDASAKPDAAPAPAPVAKPGNPSKAPDTAATVVNLKTVEGIMGKSVRSRAKEDMGRVVDVLVDGGGQIRAAVIDFGGFLGVGSRKVAVGWKTLDFTDSIQSGSVKVTLTRDQIRQSPEYKPDEPIVILEGGAAPKPAAATATPGHNQDAPAR